MCKKVKCALLHMEIYLLIVCYKYLKVAMSDATNITGFIPAMSITCCFLSLFLDFK